MVLLQHCYKSQKQQAPCNISYDKQWSLSTITHCDLLYMTLHCCVSKKTKKVTSMKWRNRKSHTQYPQQLLHLLLGNSEQVDLVYQTTQELLPTTSLALPTINWPLLPTTYWLPLPTTCWPHADHVPTTYRPRTDCLYRPRTNHLPTDQLVHYYPIVAAHDCCLWRPLVLVTMFLNVYLEKYSFQSI